MKENTSSHPHMLPIERYSRILDVLDRQSTIRTTEVCELCGVSPITARADLSELERQGKLKRTHGGAISLSGTLVVSPPNDRATINVSAKRRIAQVASTFVSDGDSLLVDTGTTTFEFVKALVRKRNLTIVTNDCAIAEYVEREMPTSVAVQLGGTVRRVHRYSYGLLTCANVKQLYADKVFMGANSLVPDVGFMTEFEPEAAVKSLFVAHARRCYMLMDSTKLGSYNYMRFAGLADFDELIIESDPQGSFATLIKEEGSATHLCVADDFVR